MFGSDFCFKYKGFMLNLKENNTGQKMKLSMKNFFSNCDQIRKKVGSKNYEK